MAGDRRSGQSTIGRRCGAVLVALLAAVIALGCVRPASAADPAFRRWLQELWPEAQKLGVSRATFDAAVAGIEPDLSLPDLVVPGRPEAPPRGQAEFVQTPEQYLRERTLANLAAEGRQLFAKHRDTLNRIEQRYRRAGAGGRGDLGPRDRVRQLQAAARRADACWRRKASTASARTSSATSSCMR